MSRDRVLMKCHVCDCLIQSGEPHYVDDWGWAHVHCALQVEL